MRFIVDELPYYGEHCPLYAMCGDSVSDERCPRYWSKYKVCSDDNPHKCKLLIEASDLALTNDPHYCRTCKYSEDSGMTYPCALCRDYSNWESKTVLSGEDMTVKKSSL